MDAIADDHGGCEPADATCHQLGATTAEVAHRSWPVNWEADTVSVGQADSEPDAHSDDYTVSDAVAEPHVESESHANRNAVPDS